MNLKVENKEKLQGEFLTQTQDERNTGILKAWLPFWVRNAFENYPHIMKEAATQHMSLENLKGTEKGPAVVIGSGPSLNETAPLLGKWKGAVFTSGSNALVATRWGHQPEYICVFDAGDTMYPKLFGYDWEGSTLLCNPSITPYILKNWKWKKYYYLMRHHGVQWFDEILPLAFGDFLRFPYQAPPCIRIGVSNAGCTVNNAIQLAHYIGYDPIFLIGVDFGYPYDANGKPMERCTRWVKSFGEWKDVGIEETHDRKLHMSDNGILTTEEQIEYKNAMMTVYKLDKPQLFDCSNGIITELPKVDFKEVVEKNGKGFEKLYRTSEEIERVYMEYEDRRKVLQAKRNADRSGENAITEIKRVVSGNSGKTESVGD